MLSPQLPSGVRDVCSLCLDAHRSLLLECLPLQPRPSVKIQLGGPLPVEGEAPSLMTHRAPALAPPASVMYLGPPGGKPSLRQHL